jgi:hypothetical protein
MVIIINMINLMANFLEMVEGKLHISKRFYKYFCNSCYSLFQCGSISQNEGQTGLKFCPKIT